MSAAMRVFMIMFVVGIIGGVHWYLYRAATRGVTRVRVRRMLLVALSALALSFPGFWIARRLAADMVPTAFLRGAFVWVGICFYLAPAVSLRDLWRALRRRRNRRAALDADPSRRALLPRSTASGAVPPANPSRRAFLLRSTAFGAAALAAPGYGFWRAWAPPEMTRTRVALPNFPAELDGFSIALLTDVHVGPWIGRSFVEEMVARTNALSPDLIAIGGDLVDGSVEDLAPYVEPLARLRSRHGTWFVTGNHDHYSGAADWCAHLETLGIKVLRNQRASIGEGAASFDLVGVDDWNSRDHPLRRLDGALEGRDPTRAAVLLAHQPLGFEEAASRGVGLQLSGHTHGGQLWPWVYAVRLAYPYTAGLYRRGDASIYVSRGCGFWGPPMRVGAPPEIATLILARGSMS